jgi:hypothetical protein
MTLFSELLSIANFNLPLKTKRWLIAERIKEKPEEVAELILLIKGAVSI